MALGWEAAGGKPLDLRQWLRPVWAIDALLAPRLALGLKRAR